MSVEVATDGQIRWLIGVLSYPRRCFDAPMEELIALAALKELLSCREDAVRYRFINAHAREILLDEKPIDRSHDPQAVHRLVDKAMKEWSVSHGT